MHPERVQDSALLLRLQEEVATLAAAARGAAEAAERGESKMRAEREGLASLKSFAEERCKEVQHQRDAANDERTKSSEALVLVPAAQRTAKTTSATAV